MIAPNGTSDSPQAPGLPDPETVLREADWESLWHSQGSAVAIPDALRALLDADPAVQARVMDEDLAPLRLETFIYPAAVPAAQYMAAILPDPRIAAIGVYRHAVDEYRQHPLRAMLLIWLGYLLSHTDDNVKAREEFGGNPSPDEETLFALRPAFYQQVAAFLHDDEHEVRYAALFAAIPLAEAPGLTRHQTELAGCARRLLATEEDTYRRVRVLNGLMAWGHDTAGLETDDDRRLRTLLNSITTEPSF
ncbi:hypothetical protein J1792_32210 [Streptomyces triculaminicus]|uniref:HEAT repeat domain-containing protein n=1 Tax=Streptomyces triculaminicus TaxID=2816232 RepID=A0A939FTT6_9ACTN|nr:hypothetical protein [Streptomyces triculaminicus]MBO0657212.1 hypothetical protein [Streptomyces triculaminicus]